MQVVVVQVLEVPGRERVGVGPPGVRAGGELGVGEQGGVEAAVGLGAGDPGADDDESLPVAGGVGDQLAGFEGEVGPGLGPDGEDVGAGATRQKPLLRSTPGQSSTAASSRAGWNGRAAR